MIERHDENMMKDFHLKQNNTNMMHALQSKDYSEKNKGEQF